MLVMVLQTFSVKLMEAFLGICGSLFPQYFTKAILLGVFHVNFAFSMECKSTFAIN
jgi:hypothetical protein